MNRIFIDGEMLFHNPTEEGEGREPDFYRIFTDDLFQGKEYTLNIYIDGSNYADSDWNDYVRQWVKVEIHTLSEKLYHNLHSQELAIGPSGDIFSEPVKIYTYTQTDTAYLAFIISVKKKNLWRQKGNDMLLYYCSLFISRYLITGGTNQLLPEFQTNI